MIDRGAVSMRCARGRAVILALVAAGLGLGTAPAHALVGTVLNEATLEPIPQATVTIDKQVKATDSHGIFAFDDAGPCDGVTVRARAPGFDRAEIVYGREGSTLLLRPVNPKALYLSFWGIGSKTLRNNALDLIDRTDLNSLVIDVKGDHGTIPYPSQVPLANEIGARKTTTVRDMREMVSSLRARGIYLIARIVVFKDDPLAKARPELAVKTGDGSMFKDREGLRWVDPTRKEVWEYNLAIAEEAASLGFDEIQFDYVRFPDRRGVVFSAPNSEANRVAAISGFIASARQRLIPYNVFLSADLFGYVAWNQNDTDIGQTLASVAPNVDYISLMLYPSGFQFGIPGYRNPVANPYETVHLTLKRASQRTGLSPLRFRPWLQAFRDYAFDKRHFTKDEIKAQVRASEHFGSSGWMLWNPRNSYEHVAHIDE
jgi:hypothetical protein